MSKKVDSKNKTSELRKKIKDLQAELNKEAEAEFKDAFKDFFDQNPNVVAVHWEQYTPYFNDGDSCRFGVGSYWLEFNYTPEELKATAEKLFNDEPDIGNSVKAWEEWLTSPEGLRETYDEKEFASKDSQFSFNESEKKSLKEFKKVWNDVVEDDLFESLFGDHVTVKATREGFTSTSYDNHD